MENTTKINYENSQGQTQVVVNDRLFGFIEKIEEKVYEAKNSRKKTQARITKQPRYVIKNLFEEYLCSDHVTWTKNVADAQSFALISEYKIVLENYFKPTESLSLFEPFKVSMEQPIQPEVLPPEENIEEWMLNEFLASGIPIEVTLATATAYESDPNSPLFDRMLYKLKNQQGDLSDNAKKYYSAYAKGGWVGNCLKFDGSPNPMVQVKCKHPRIVEGEAIKYDPTARCNYSGEDHPYILPDLNSRNILDAIIKKICDRHNINLDPRKYNNYAEFFHDAKQLIPVSVTEGFKKTLSLIVQGFLGFGLLGVNNWTWTAIAENGEKVAKTENGVKLLNPQIKAALEGSKAIEIYFDMDAKPTAKRNVGMALEALVTTLNYELEPDDKDDFIRVAKWDRKVTKAKGIDDLFANGFTTETIDYQYLDIEAIEAETKERLKKQSEKKEKSEEAPKNETTLIYEFIQQHWGDKIRFNELSNSLDFSPEFSEDFLEDLHVEIALISSFKPSKEVVHALVNKIARENAYHPYKDYFKRISSDPSVPTINLKTFASKYLGATKRLHNLLFEKSAISWVARIMHNDFCGDEVDSFGRMDKFDNMLVLVGSQAMNKSSLFSTLAGTKYYNGRFTAFDDGNLLIAHQFLFNELQEVERFYKKYNAEEIKMALSTQVDTIRDVYKRIRKPRRRQFSFVATANNYEFLNDSTGNRREFIIPVNTKIDLPTLRKIKDSFWKSAYQAYLNGETWWLNADQEKVNMRVNSQYRNHGLIYESLINFLNLDTNYPKDKVEITQIAGYLKTEGFNTSDTMGNSIAKYLRELGYDNKKRNLTVTHPDGTRHRCWALVDPEAYKNSIMDIDILDEAYTPEMLTFLGCDALNASPDKGWSGHVTPVTPKIENFSQKKTSENHENENHENEEDIFQEEITKIGVTGVTESPEPLPHNHLTTSHPKKINITGVTELTEKEQQIFDYMSQIPELFNFHSVIAIAKILWHDQATFEICAAFEEILNKYVDLGLCERNIPTFPDQYRLKKRAD